MSLSETSLTILESAPDLTGMAEDIVALIALKV